MKFDENKIDRVFDDYDKYKRPEGLPTKAQQYDLNMLIDQILQLEGPDEEKKISFHEITGTVFSFEKSPFNSFTWAFNATFIENNLSEQKNSEEEKNLKQGKSPKKRQNIKQKENADTDFFCVSLRRVNVRDDKEKLLLSTKVLFINAKEATVTCSAGSQAEAFEWCKMGQKTQIGTERQFIIELMETKEETGNNINSDSDEKKVEKDASSELKEKIDNKKFKLQVSVFRTKALHQGALEYSIAVKISDTMIKLIAHFQADETMTDLKLEMIATRKDAVEFEKLSFARNDSSIYNPYHWINQRR